MMLIIYSILSAPIWYEIAKSKAMNGKFYAGAGVVGAVILTYTIELIIFFIFWIFPGRFHLLIYRTNIDIMNFISAIITVFFWHGFYTRWLWRIGRK